MSPLTLGSMGGPMLWAMARSRSLKWKNNVMKCISHMTKFWFPVLCGFYITTSMVNNNNNAVSMVRQINDVLTGGH